MIKYTSETLDTYATNNQFEAEFKIGRGSKFNSEQVTINNEMITNYAIAKARAEATFLEQSYYTNKISFSTYHVDNVRLGDIIQLNSVLWKIETIQETIQGAKVALSIVATRWI